MTQLGVVNVPSEVKVVVTVLPAGAGLMAICCAAHLLDVLPVAVLAVVAVFAAGPAKVESKLEY